MTEKIASRTKNRARIVNENGRKIAAIAARTSGKKKLPSLPILNKIKRKESKPAIPVVAAAR